MQTEFPDKFHSLTRVSATGSWIETLVLTALAIGLGFWLAPDDPLLVHNFPWPLLAPLLAAVRYGFLKGLLSAGLLVAALLIFRAQGLPAYAELPSTYIIGTLVCAMVVGEFRDLWDRRLEKLQMANTYRQYRLDEFTRAYQVLRISHDLLEQRIAASDQSLRSSLLILRDRMRDLKGSEEALVWLAEPILDLLAQYGSLRVAAIYPTDKLGRLQPWPLAAIGGMAELEIEDPLVQLCLERRELVSVGEVYIERGDQRGFSSLQACVPLVDTEGRLLALVAIRHMPFFMFNDKTLSLLVLLAGHAADLLRSDPATLRLESADAQRFSQQLVRTLLDAEKQGLPGLLFMLELLEPDEDLVRLFTDSQRGLDLQLRTTNARGNDCVLILMPLTVAAGADGYVKRLEERVAQHFGTRYSLEEVDVRATYFEITAGSDRKTLHRFLADECALGEQQVAV